MGMYDNLFINVNKLPISDDDKKKIKKEWCFQTKDFDCVLTEIYITDEGKIEVNEWKYEEVPKEERPHPDGEGLLGLIGSIRRTDEHRVELKDYHGYVNFYTSVGDEWFEFNAKFTNGKLESIERVSEV